MLENDSDTDEEANVFVNVDVATKHAACLCSRYISTTHGETPATAPGAGRAPERTGLCVCVQVP